MQRGLTCEHWLPRGRLDLIKNVHRPRYVDINRNHTWNIDLCWCHNLHVWQKRIPATSNHGKGNAIVTFTYSIILVSGSQLRDTGVPAVAGGQGLVNTLSDHDDIMIMIVMMTHLTVFQLTSPVSSSHQMKPEAVSQYVQDWSCLSASSSTVLHSIEPAQALHNYSPIFTISPSQSGWVTSGQH